MEKNSSINAVFGRENESLSVETHSLQKYLE
jgi:hypothetical protein